MAWSWLTGIAPRTRCVTSSWHATRTASGPLAAPCTTTAGEYRRVPSTGEGSKRSGPGPVASLVTAPRPFHLDDVGAQVAEHHRAERSRQHPREVEHANSGEWLCHGFWRRACRAACKVLAPSWAAAPLPPRSSSQGPCLAPALAAGFSCPGCALHCGVPYRIDAAHVGGDGRHRLIELARSTSTHLLEACTGVGDVTLSTRTRPRALTNRRRRHRLPAGPAGTFFEA